LAVGIGQALHVMPAAVSALAMRIDISDAANPDGYLNIPLAYAGPGTEFNIAYSSDTGLDGAAPTGYQSFLAAFGAGATAFFMLSDGAGRTLGGVWTVNSSTPAMRPPTSCRGPSGTCAPRRAHLSPIGFGDRPSRHETPSPPSLAQAYR
jgi:hypothetical protein